MGLDQYIYKTRRDEIAYFRKVNFLQGYFENKYPDKNLNCEYVRIQKEDVEDIIERCNNILEHVTFSEDKSLEGVIWSPKAVEIAKKEMPIKEGFFYGSYEYDSWFFDDVKEVKEVFEKILKETDFDEDTIEYSCWY